MHESFCSIKEALKEMKSIVLSIIPIGIMLGYTLSLILHHPNFISFLLLGPTFEAVLIWYVWYNHEIKVKEIDWHRRDMEVMAQMLKETGVNSIFYEEDEKSL